MSVPSKPSFIEVARMMNQLVPELSKNLKPLKPVFKAAKEGKEFANGLADVGKRSKYFIEDWKFNQGRAGTAVKTVTKEAKKVTKELTKTQKVVNVLNKDVKKIFKEFFDKVGGIAKSGTILSDAGKFLVKFAPILNAVLAVGLTFAANEIQGWRNDENEKGIAQLSADVSKVLGKLNQYQQRIDNTNKKIDITNRDVDSLSKKYAPLKAEIRQAEKKANDSLYETREGRRIVEGKIADTRKLANDSLAETRGTAQKIRQEFTQQQQQIKQQIAEVLKAVPGTATGVSNAIQTAINSAISKVQSDINNVRSQVASIKPPQTVDINSIVDRARASAQQEVSSLRSQLNALGSLIPGLQRQSQVALEIGGANAQGIAQVDRKADQAMQEAKKKGIPDLTPLQTALDRKFNEFVAGNNKALNIQDLKISDLSKDFDRRNAEFIRQAGLSADQRFAEFQRSNNEALKVRDLKISDLSKEFDRKLADFERQSNSTSQQRFDEFTKQNERDLKKIGADLTTINTKIKEGEKVNDRVEKKIDGLIPKIDGIIPTIAGIPLIAGKAADLIRPSIPTLPQIENATGTAMCRNLRTGCGKQAIDDAVGVVAGNNNQNTNAILGALNTASNVADLALLPIINNKLGDQVDGGISGKLNRVAKWLHLDRALNILIWWQTLHNAYMLSANLGQTLTSAISNVLAAIGIKDAEGSPLDIGEILGGQFDNLAKTVIGESEWGSIKAEYKKWNRIYQAAANLMNSIQSIGYSILSALETVGSWIASIGNALRKWGEVGETAYRWMNPTPNFQNKFFTTLENVDNVVSQIDSVASEVLSVQETVTQIGQQKDEFLKSLGEQEESKQSTLPPEAAKVKTSADDSKRVSANGVAIRDSDKEADE